MREKFLLLASAVLLLVGCGTNNNNNQKDADNNKASDVSTTYAPGTRRMKRSVEDITKINTEADYQSMIANYWNDFDFDAGENVIAYDTLDIIYAMSDYVMYIPPRDADSLLRGLMRKASTSRPVLNFFITITEIVLHNPNSPMRNDEYYIAILETILESPLLDEYERIAPTYDLEIARKNRIGTIANDFVYTLSNGKKCRLHDIDADYVILMFSNPGCPLCRQIMDEITASPILNELTELKRLKTISIYPDADLEAWRSYLSEMPESWIKAYDDGMMISQQRLYNLNAIPALYLLDKTKRVLVKDGTSVAYIENVIALMDSM